MPENFAQSEIVWWVANICMAYGALDLIIGLGWLRHKPEVTASFPRLREALPWLVALDVLLIVTGLYLLHLHGQAI